MARNDRRWTDGDDLRGRRVVVWGLGRQGGGVGAVRWLVERGADVVVMDRATAASLDRSVRALAGLPIRWRLGAEDPAVLADSALVVVNPAVDKQTSPLFRFVVDRQLAWTTEANLFLTRCPATVIGVTGSFGKSTTSAMMACALRAAVDVDGGSAGQVYLGGNIGRSLLPDLRAMTAADFVVMELSSAQLEDVPSVGGAPAWAIITNVFDHHLDRHGTFEAYLDTKLGIVAPEGRTRAVVLGPMPMALQTDIGGRLADRDTRVVGILPESAGLTEDGCSAYVPPGSGGLGDRMVWREVGLDADLCVPGRHNRDNARCVLLMLELLGLDTAGARAALYGFRGLPHRLEHVRTLDGVAYVNDSKATSPAATLAAARTLESPLVVIVGGANGREDFDACAVGLMDRCRGVVCQGASGAAMAERLARVSGGRGARVCVAANLAEAVEAARSLARDGDAVVFSPGATSFDAYENYQERGRHFARLVEALT